LELTASGGPFRTWSAEQMANATVSQALAHPNWDMGRKISIDSATMMNKGLEIIEASHLFGVAERDIEVVVHPQSIVHSMVRYADGSVIAQMGNADMRTPIAHALAWPARIDSGVAPIDFTRAGSLEFEAPDELRFPCLWLARRALELGGSAPAVLNAANEVAVESFLQERIGFSDIARINRETLQRSPQVLPTSVESLEQIDHDARQLAIELVDGAFSSTETT
jgi:1-deoxy-D-xylulose-5-phosphate reductoisomerase